MTGREKIEAAFSDGSACGSAVICYEGIFIRDHWDSLAGADWWAQFSPDLDEQVACRARVVERLGQDWLRLPPFMSTAQRQDMAIEQRGAEIERQHEAGRRNGGRFIMSVGSPVTPETPVDRVRRYCDLVHELS